MKFKSDVDVEAALAVSGDVGVGTTSPSFGTGGGLQISNAAQANLRFTDTSSATFITDLALSNENFYLINRSASGSLKFRVNSSNEALTILSSGNVGIGTTSPSYKLDVAGNIRVDSTSVAQIFLDSAASNDAVLNFHENASQKGKIGYDTSLGGIALVAGSGAFSTADMVLLDGGNVGIGTTSPGDPLHILSGGTDDFIRIENTNTYTGLWMNDGGTNNGWLVMSGYTNTPSAGDFAIREYGVQTSLVIKQTSGNVGIGTISPENLLHVKASDGNTAVIKIEGGNNVVTANGEINSRLEFGSNDGSVNSSGNVGGSIASVTENTNGAITGLAFSTFYQSRTPNDLAEAMRITGAGNVGIGTTSPTHLLTLETASSPGLKIKDTTQGATLLAFSQDSNSHVGTFSSHPLVLDTNSTERMRITSAGDVGIGTSAPGDKLTVNGNISLENSGTPIFTLKDTGNSGGGGAAGIIRFKNNSGDAIGIGYTGNDTTTSDLLISTNAASTYGGYLGLDANAITDPSSIILDPKTSVIINGDVVIGEHRIINLPSFNMGGGGVTDEYLVVCKQAPSGGGVDASGIQGRISFSRGSDGSFNNSHYMDINIQMSLDSGSVNTLDVTQFELYRDSTNPFFSQLEEIDIDGTKYVALKARSSGGGSDNHNYFEGSISDASDTNILSRVRASDSTVTVTAPQPTGFPITPYITKNQDGNVGIGTTTPTQKLEVAGNIKLSGYIVDSNSEIIDFAVNDLRVQGKHINAEFGVWARSYGTVRQMGIDGGASYMGLYTSGTEKVRIDTSGNVGIGTTSPSTSLHVVKDASWEVARFEADSYPTATVYSQAAAKYAQLNIYDTRINSEPTMELRADTPHFNIRLDDTGNVLTILDGGNVGIGTTSPQVKLHVEGRIRSTYDGNTAWYSGNYVRLFNSQSFGFLNSSGSSIAQINLNGNSYFNGGNVGIGTTSPSAKLNVKSSDSTADQITLTHSGNTVNIVAIGQESSHGSLFLRANSGVNKVRLSAAGNNSYILDSNVGIGTTSPNTALQVNQNTTVPLLIHRPSNTSFDPHGIGFSTRNDTANGGLGDVRSGIFSDYNGDLFLAAATSSITTSPLVSSRLFIEGSNGNVGIGTTSPSEKLEVAGNIKIGDSNVMYLGAGNDLQIYHDGSNSYIDDTGTGWLRLRGNGGIILSSYSESETMLQATRNGSVALYYDNSKKFETTSTGVEVTGKITNLTAGTGNLDAVNVQQLNDATTGALIFQGTWSAASTTTGVHAAGSTSTIIVLEDPNLGVSIGSTVTGTGIPAGTTVTTYYNSGAFGLSAAITMVNGAVATFTTVGGIPDLSRADQKVTGNYYICETAGVATPNGAGTTPDDWAVGDWVAFSDLATDAWQKIDNSSVLSGAGTGGKVPVWSGTGTSVTLADAPITVSGNNATFAGDVSLTGGSLSISGDGSNAVTFTETGAGKMTVSAADDIILDAGSDIVLDAGGDDLRLKVSGTEYAKFNNSSSNLNIFSSIQDKAIKFIGNDNGTEITALTLNMADGGDATFAGSITTNLSSEGTYFTGGSGGLRQLSITSGTNTSAHALHTFNIASSNGKYEFDVNGTTELSLDSSSATFAGDVYIPEYIYHSGDTNTYIRFTADTQTFRTGGDDRLILTNTTATFAGNLTVGGNITTNSGIFYSGNATKLDLNQYNSGYLRLLTNNTERVRVTATGNVGIGTTSPASKLEVNVTDDTFNDINVLKLKRTWATGSGSDRAHGISFNDANSTNATIYVDRTNSGANYNSDLLFATNTGTSGTSVSTKMVIKADGNVGIGTTSPSEMLHIKKSSGTGSFIRFEDTGGSGVYIGSRSNTMELYAGGAEAMRITSARNVGIGTTNPQSKLQVAGGIQMADDQAAASAAKVGTMRYRTGTEYVEVNGTELVTNGDFATDTDWTKDTGWAIGGGTANGTAAVTPLYQTVSGFTAGSKYRVRFEVTAVTSGYIRVYAYVGASGTFTNIFSTTSLTTGTYEGVFEFGGANKILRFYGSVSSTGGFTGSIDNVSVIEVTAEDASYADMCMQTGSSTYEWVNIVRNTY